MGEETRVQLSEELLMELAKLQMQYETQLMDLEGCTQCENIRIYGVKVGERTLFCQPTTLWRLLEKTLGLPCSPMLGVKRAHSAVASKPPDRAPLLRSFVVKFACYCTKEAILKRTWQAKSL